jgi:tetratricopeptide (TPR) repeat protein
MANLSFAGDLKQDLEYYQEQLRQNPKDPNVNYNMGQVYFFMGKTDEAIRYLERAIYLNDKDNEAMLKLASIYRKIGHLSEALRLLKNAARIDDSNSEIWYETGVVYSDLADYQAGIEAFQKALHLSRSEEQKFLIIYYTGLLHLSNRDWENYSDCLRRLRPAPSYYSELEKLGRLWKN